MLNNYILSKNIKKDFVNFIQTILVNVNMGVIAVLAMIIETYKLN